MADPPPDRTPSGPLPALISLGQSLAGASHRDTIAALLASALRSLLAPDSLLLMLADADSGTRRVAYAHNIADPRADDPLIERALHGPKVEGSWLGSPLRGAAGRTIGAVYATAGGGSGFDDRHLEVTTAALTQAAIALENSRLLELLSDGKREWEQTVDAVSEAFCVLDREGRVLRANRAFGELARHPLTALAGRPWMSLLPADWAGPIARALAAPERGGVELLAGGRLYTVTALSVAEDGTCVLVFADQTDKKRLQEQLIQSEKMSAIGQLIAGVAHDLNNPLASVVGFADYLLETEQGAGPHLLEPLRAIQQEAMRAAAIVHNLLSFARKNEGRRRGQPIGPVLEATLLLLKNQLMACRVESHLQVDPELPEVRLDANQIQQVFVNLISNAAQAVQASGRDGNVWIRVTRWLDGIAVTFEDDGPGIGDQIADKIFEPFFTTKPEGQGTGLGLSICQGIVREHGGRISLAKRAGGGAALRVELPGASTPPKIEPQEAVPAATGTLGILVVDDEPHILHYMRATLEAWGHRVAVAADGEAALVRARVEPFDVIITDVRMPHFGGRELYESLSRERPDLAAHVIFSTGDIVRGDTLQFLESLGRPFLHKPFSLAQLRSALGAATQP